MNNSIYSSRLNIESNLNLNPDSKTIKTGFDCLLDASIIWIGPNAFG